MGLGVGWETNLEQYARQAQMARVSRATVPGAMASDRAAGASRHMNIPPYIIAYLSVICILLGWPYTGYPLHGRHLENTTKFRAPPLKISGVFEVSPVQGIVRPVSGRINEQTP